MKQKGTHQKCVPFFCAARFLGCRIPRDSIARKTPQGMGSGPHAQRPVVGPAIVEMNPHRQHLLQEHCGRLRVMDAVLDRPGRPSIDVAFYGNGDRQILMPGYRPVRGWRLVEEDTANGASPRADDRVDDGCQRPRPRKCSNLVELQQVTDAERLPMSLGTRVLETGESDEKFGNMSAAQNARHDGVAASCDLVGESALRQFALPPRKSFILAKKLSVSGWLPWWASSSKLLSNSFCRLVSFTGVSTRTST